MKGACQASQETFTPVVNIMNVNVCMIIPKGTKRQAEMLFVKSNVLDPGYNLQTTVRLKRDTSQTWYSIHHMAIDTPPFITVSSSACQSSRSGKVSAQCGQRPNITKYTIFDATDLPLWLGLHCVPCYWKHRDIESVGVLSPVNR